MIERFREVVENRHQYAQEWKEKTGKKVVGYFCTYVPEEIIYAADMLPVRIMGGHEPSTLSDDHIAWVYCPLSRDILAEGLRGRYKYLDGLVNPYGCIHMRQAFWSWQEHIPLSFLHHMFVPYQIQHRAAEACVLEEVRKFKTALEKWRGKSISEKELDRAIGIYNKNRRLLQQIYDLRKDANPPLLGSEAMEIVLAGMYMDKEEHNQLLEQLLKELPGRSIDGEAKVRLMLIGTVFDDIEILRLFESLGGSAVVDDLCNGRRYFLQEVVPEGDRVSALTDRYVNKLTCPVRDFDDEARLARLKQLIKDYNIQGIVFVQQRFCDPIEYDIGYLRPRLQEMGINTLWLELDVINPAGQFRTRIEAFLETYQTALI